MPINLVKSKFEAQFSINIENQIFNEHLVKFIDPIKNELNFVDFIKDQKQKIYEGGADENCLLFNEVVLLFLNFLGEIETERKKYEKFVIDFSKEADFFNFERFFFI